MFLRIRNKSFDLKVYKNLEKVRKPLKAFNFQQGAFKRSFQLSMFENFEQCFSKYVSLKVSFLLAPRDYIFLTYIPLEVF